MSVRLRVATTADLPLVEELLVEAGLITAGVPEQIEQFLLAEEEDGIVGSAGLERYGTEALLRSVAVAPGHRNRGVARTLVSRLLADAARQQIREVYLFTTTAPDYFRRFGFELVSREDVAQSVQASEEYGVCCSGAHAMRLVLPTEKVPDG